MPAVISQDGTRIAFDQVGEGPPLIMVVGAFNTRSTAADLANWMANDFAVITYDRRGRGESGDTLPYEVDREVEDLGALIAQSGGTAAVFGYSSGGCLALEAAIRGLSITRLALYDAPYLAGGTTSPRAVDHAAALSRLIEEGRRGDAVEYFQSKIVGLPDDLVAQLRHAPFRPALEALAHTLVYDAMLVGDRSLPPEAAGAVSIPVLAVAGGAGDASMPLAAQGIGQALPQGQAEVLAGQNHDIDPLQLGPVLRTFFLKR